MGKIIMFLGFSLGIITDKIYKKFTFQSFRKNIMTGSSPFYNEIVSVTKQNFDVKNQLG